MLGAGQRPGLGRGAALQTRGPPAGNWACRLRRAAVMDALCVEDSARLSRWRNLIALAAWSTGRSGGGRTRSRGRERGEEARAGTGAPRPCSTAPALAFLEPSVGERSSGGLQGSSGRRGGRKIRILLFQIAGQI